MSPHHHGGKAELEIFPLRLFFGRVSPILFPFLNQTPRRSECYLVFAPSDLLPLYDKPLLERSSNPLVFRILTVEKLPPQALKEGAPEPGSGYFFFFSFFCFQ